ncbi:MAG: SH3 domain-containing protein [Pseudomonadota bacterium]
MTGLLHGSIRVLLVFLLFAVPRAQAQQMVSVAGAEVNLRSGPGTQHPADWTLGKGYPLKVLARKGSWLQVVDFENDRGWIYRPLTSSTRYHIVKVDKANMRSQPTTRSRILAKLSYGDLLRTLDRKSDWVKVQRPGGLKGWVARRLLWGW